MHYETRYGNIISLQIQGARTETYLWGTSSNSPSSARFRLMPLSQPGVFPTGRSRAFTVFMGYLTKNDSVRRREKMIDRWPQYKGHGRYPRVPLVVLARLAGPTLSCSGLSGRRSVHGPSKSSPSSNRFLTSYNRYDQCCNPFHYCLRQDSRTSLSNKSLRDKVLQLSPI